jgi:hypothetical protein
LLVIEKIEMTEEELTIKILFFSPVRMKSSGDAAIGISVQLRSGFTK